MAVRRKHIRSLAREILSRYSIHEAPVPVEKIVQNLGIELKKEPVDDELSGFLVRDMKQGTAIIGVNAGHPSKRVRFTIAHELGHYLLHEGETVHFDGKSPGLTVVNLRNAKSSAGIDDNEKEANLFAAELLMPADFLERDLHDVSEDFISDEAIQDLAERYEVSVQALTFRLANLEYLEL